MKTGPLIFGLSGASLVLIASIAVVAKGPQASTAIQARTESQTLTNIKYRFVQEDAAPAVIAPAPAFSWHTVESEDYKQYIANLRDIDCPEETIRDIIIADVNKLYAPREAPFKTRARNTDRAEELVMADGMIVSGSSATRQAEFEKRKQLRAIQKEKNALLKELLGIELPLEVLRARDSRNYEEFEWAFNALPANKRELVREIQENYWQTSDALKDKYNNRRNAEYLEEYKRINVERRAELAKVLTPNEMEDYEMRTSNISGSVRSSVEGFNVTEEEYRKLFRIRREIELPYGGNLGGGVAVDASGNLIDQDGRAYAQREKQADEKIKEALGEERFAQYKLNQDYTYRSLNQLAERYGLPQESILKALDVQKAYREQQQALRSNRALTSEQRQMAAQELRAETDKAMGNALGEKPANAFKK